MRITEKRLRGIIRQVILESGLDYRLKPEFGMKVRRIADDVKQKFIDHHSMLRVFDESDLDDYKVDDFLQKYIGELIHLHGERIARSKFEGNQYYVTQAFKIYLGKQERGRPSRF